MWKDLTMQQRADLMDIYLNSGIYSLNEMKSHYDSRKKFEDGGNLFDGTNENSQQINRPNIFRYDDGRYVYQAAPNAEEIDVTPINTLIPDASQWTYQDAEGRVYTPHAAQVDTGSITQDENTNPLMRAANNYVREFSWRAQNDPSSIALQGKYTMPAVLSPLLAPLGEAAYPYVSSTLSNPYVDAGLTSTFGAHGVNHIVNEGTNGWGDAAMTALEIAPLGRLARPMWNTGKQIAERWVEKQITPEGLLNDKPLIAAGIETNSNPLVNGFEGIEVPEGYTPVRVLNLRTRNGNRVVHQVRENSTGKFKNLEDMQFQSELDWSPKSWYEEAAGRRYKDGSPTQYNDRDIKALESHVPEYIEIERKAKQDGTWLKMPDGSTWEGDPRSWVQYKSRAAQEHNPEVFWTGIHKEIDPNYNDRLWGLPADNQSTLAPARARTYTKDDSQVMPMFTTKYENPESISTIDAKGANWRMIKDKGKIKDTDLIVDENSGGRKKVVKIKNVVDLGDHKVPADSKYYYDNIGNNETIPQDDIILHPGTLRKALIGNNGNFKHRTNMYRGLIPLGIGYPFFDILNENQ